MRLVLSVGLQDLDIQQVRFKKCIIEAWGRGKITLHRFDQELTPNAETFRDLKDSQKKLGLVQGSTLLLQVGRKSIPI